jgi:sporulation protein YlmC with PRC-barrel domain
MQPYSLSASTITGDDVRNPNGDKLGHIEEIVIDLEDGRVNYAVLSSGGFLGLGDKLFAIPWDMIHVDTERKEVVIDLSKEAWRTHQDSTKTTGRMSMTAPGWATCIATTGASLTGRTSR